MLKNVLFVIAVFTCSVTWSSSAVVSKLESDTRTLKSDIGNLQSKADHLKTKLETLEQRLSIPAHIAHDLGELDDTMGEVKKVASVAKLVPPIKGQSEAVVEGIDVTKPPVHESRVIMQKVADAIEPVRKEVQNAIKKIEEIQGKVNEFKAKKITPFYNDIIEAQSCVDKSDPKHLSCMQGKLDDVAKPADAAIAKIDQGLGTLISDIDKIVGFVEDIEKQLSSIEKLIDGINLLEHDLNLLIHPFLELKKLLDKRFTVKFPYPDPKNIFKKKYFSIKLHGRDIIKGIKSIEKKIEKMIKGALLKAAKAFGLKNLAKKLFNLFDHPFKIIMKKLHLKIKIKIPGLDKLKGLDVKLNPLLVNLNLSLKKLDFNFKTPQITACGELSKTCK